MGGSGLAADQTATGMGRPKGSRQRDVRVVVSRWLVPGAWGTAEGSETICPEATLPEVSPPEVASLGEEGAWRGKEEQLGKAHRGRALHWLKKILET